MGLRAFTFDGTSSSDFGMFITEASPYNAPERAVEMIEIPGRNGAYALDKGNFENVEQTYHVVVHGSNDADFREMMSDVRNWLCSKIGYCRLSDDYNPGEYRMATYKSGLETDSTFWNGTEFDVTFDCKPQRYLAIGEELTEIGAWGNTETAEGEVVTIDASSDTAVKALTADIEPIQDLHGYDAPWVGGAGKNKWSLCDQSFTQETSLNIQGLFEVGVSYVFSCLLTTQATTSCQIVFVYTDGTTLSKYITPNTGNRVSTSSIVFEKEPKIIYLRSADNYNHAAGLSCSYTDIQLELGSSMTSYAPYENICPISGHDDVTVTVADDVDNPTVSEDYTTTLPSTTYGGTLDVVSGTLKPAPYYASYNGEALEGEWVSDRDKYVAGTTPTTGAQVVNIGKVGTATQLTGQSIELLEGENHIFADSGQVTVEYGHNPTLLTNPTWFPSKPLLAVDGYGEIKFNNRSIVNIENATLGDIKQLVNESKTLSMTTTFDNAMFNVGDTITVDLSYFNYGAYIIMNASTTPTTSGTVTDSDAHFTTVVTDCVADQGISPSPLYVHVKTTCTPITFTLGTPDTVTNTTEAVVDTQGDKCKWTQTVKYEIDGSGNHKISIKQTLVGASGTNVTTATNMNSNPMILCNSVVAHSTLSILGNPTYIDCDIGEAYMETGGSIVSLNQYIDLGSDLPTLPSGDTKVTYDNTITKVEVKPNWWKV